MQLHRGKHRARHRYPRAALWAAGGLGLAALVWMIAGVPTFVKYPTDLDVTTEYEGTFSLLVDPGSAAPLDEPMEMPLTVHRHLEAVGSESGASRVVIEERIDQQAGDLVDITQTNTYVMDRSSIENVADDRAFAFDEGNMVDRSGAFRLHLPFDTSRGETYPIYQNEIDDTYTLVPDTETPTVELEGLELSNFVAAVDEAPLTDAYLAELRQEVPLPESLTLDQLAPHLAAFGIDVDAVLAALTPVLTPEDAATLAEFAATPIDLEYVLSLGGEVAIEPVTGAQVRVNVNSERFAARPVLTDLPALQGVLGNYPDVPEAVATNEALDELATAPAIPVFEFSYQQTPASIAEVADDVRPMRTQVLLAKVWLPLGLVAAALVSLAVGAAVYLRRGPTGGRVHEMTGPSPAPRPAHEEHDTATTGRSAA